MTYVQDMTFLIVLSQPLTIWRLGFKDEHPACNTYCFKNPMKLKMTKIIIVSYCLSCLTNGRWWLKWAEWVAINYWSYWNQVTIFLFYKNSGWTDLVLLYFYFEYRERPPAYTTQAYSEINRVLIINDEI